MMEAEHGYPLDSRDRCGLQTVTDKAAYRSPMIAPGAAPAAFALDASGNVSVPSLLVANLGSSSTTGNVFAAGNWHLNVPQTSTPPANRQLSFQMADGGSSLVIRVRGSDGSLRQGTVPLTLV